MTGQVLVVSISHDTRSIALKSYQLAASMHTHIFVIQSMSTNRT